MSKLFFNFKFWAYLNFQHYKDCIILNKKQTKALCDFIYESNREDKEKLLEIINLKLDLKSKINLIKRILSELEKGSKH